MPSIVKMLSETKSLISPPKFVPNSIQYETLMGSLAYGINDKNSDIEAEESIIPIGKNAKKLAYLLAKEITEKIKNYFKTSKYNKINK